MKKDGIHEYLVKGIFAFGFTMIFLSIMTLLIGDEAKGFSAMFECGSESIPISIILEFLLASVIFSLERFLFMTDRVIKKMSLLLRTAFLVITSVITGVIFILVFDWFPADSILSWVGFGISFSVCFALSLIITAIREKKENQKMAAALEKMKSNK